MQLVGVAGHDDGTDDVGKQSAASCECDECKAQAHQRRVNVKIFRNAGTHTVNLFPSSPKYMRTVPMTEGPISMFVHLSKCGLFIHVSLNLALGCSIRFYSFIHLFIPHFIPVNNLM